VITDLDRDALERYRSSYTEPADFDEFWRDTLAAEPDPGPRLTLVPVATSLRSIEVFDVTFTGFGGHPIRGWLRLPRDRAGQLPAIVQFHGYGSGRGRPTDDLLWSSAGYAHLLMDTRGQGGGYAGGGATADPAGSGPSYPGFLTRGIQDKHSYYYRRVFTDAVAAVRAIRGAGFADPARVAVVGASQGGGIALAAAGLVPGLAAVYVQAPFLCDIRRATLITDAEPYAEIGGYLAAHRDSVSEVFATLAYFDGIAFARRATAPAWFSAGLMDSVCPPSTAYGAFHAYGGPKQIRLWDYSGHEAGGSHDLEIVLAAFETLLSPGTPVASGRHHDGRPAS
jgi:cephalosporin-C deacetylase